MRGIAAPLVLLIGLAFVGVVPAQSADTSGGAVERAYTPLNLDKCRHADEPISRAPCTM